VIDCFGDGAGVAVGESGVRRFGPRRETGAGLAGAKGKNRLHGAPRRYDAGMSESIKPAGAPAKRPRPHHDTAGNSVAEVLQWVGEVVATGVAGNLAYDVLKTNVLRFKGRRRRSYGSEADARELLRYLACRAVIDQCKAHDLPAPDIRRLEVRSIRQTDADGDNVHEVMVGSTFESPFSARVYIPVSQLEDKTIRVTIYNAITWDAVPETGVSAR
jgi:hypothetical protein